MSTVKLSITAVVPLFMPSGENLDSFACALETNKWSPEEIVFVAYKTGYSEEVEAFITRIKNLDIKVKWQPTEKKGIFTAQNIGGYMSTYKWIIFMGIDDLFADISEDQIYQIEKSLSREKVEIIVIPYISNGVARHSSISILSYFIDTLHQQGTLYAKRLFTVKGFFPNKTGLYLTFQTTFNIAMSKLTYTKLKCSPLIIYGLSGRTNQSKVFLFDRIKDYYCVYIRSNIRYLAIPMITGSFLLTLLQQIINFIRI